MQSSAAAICAAGRGDRSILAGYGSLGIGQSSAAAICAAGDRSIVAGRGDPSIFARYGSLGIAVAAAVIAAAVVCRQMEVASAVEVEEFSAVAETHTRGFFLRQVQISASTRAADDASSVAGRVASIGIVAWSGVPSIFAG